MSESAVAIQLRQQEALRNLTPYAWAAHRELARMASVAGARVARLIEVERLVRDAQPKLKLLPAPLHREG